MGVFRNVELLPFNAGCWFLTLLFMGACGQVDRAMNSKGLGSCVEVLSKLHSIPPLPTQQILVPSERKLGVSGPSCLHTVCALYSHRGGNNQSINQSRVPYQSGTLETMDRHSLWSCDLRAAIAKSVSIQSLITEAKCSLVFLVPPCSQLCPLAISIDIHIFLPLEYGQNICTFFLLSSS